MNRELTKVMPQNSVRSDTDSHKHVSKYADEHRYDRYNTLIQIFRNGVT